MGRSSKFKGGGHNKSGNDFTSELVVVVGLLIQIVNKIVSQS